MKKIALVLAIFMVIGAAPGFCGLVGPVDTVIEHTMESDLRPIEDTGRILDVANKGIDTTYNTVTKPLGFILNPVRKIRDVTLDGTKRVINFTWDTVTLKTFRG